MFTKNSPFVTIISYSSSLFLWSQIKTPSANTIYQSNLNSTGEQSWFAVIIMIIVDKLKKKIFV